ncbi:hypothetical protein PC118_g6956 [Phytophthora cactorum]|uniref:FYVE-type domain-containing protein n=1 Tax=Phytophthora cactorum TaxID=29920 RepID=A0A8T0Y8X1_9STRA|nr:hypothetical protein PC112_g20437 [Phytophthora cactorum]KAG2804648.1 hypothetical protein PC111_g18170 [Phytophthora cactorum]KAG2834873.1 hypothetical protein PC113_g20310 [Phytophthora cactorum]KAG2905390.1 hypothetical protein PC117_g20771 [Phytophthora cactorum]KAG2988072.1 hypothetical protein PC118_g6956 [Phytophthora cactorum]
MLSAGRSRSATFEPLHLTEKQQQECQDLTFQLLDRTLRSYDACLDSHSGTPRHHADLDRSRWKQLKTQANASLYAERTDGPWRDFHSPRGNCTLLAVGTIHDTLDEVMFGLETPDFAAIQLRSETLFKHRLDGAVLAQLAGPTETDPFQFMGITRMVGQRNWPLNLVAHPRDFIVVSATGVMMHTNGELIGYEVVQSIDLPQCPPLPKPTVRGELMYGVIYRQREDGDVDVFVQMHMETRCHLYDKLVIAEIWESALGFWNAPSLAEAKKLQWCLHQKSVLPWQSQETSGEDNCIKSKHCENCPSKRSSTSRRRSTHLSDHSTCAICRVQICSSCRVKRTLKETDENGNLDLHIAVCRVCMLLVQHQEPAEIALDNQKQREAHQNNGSKREKKTRSAFLSGWGVPTFSPGRYPSISVSDLLRMVNSLSDVGINQVQRASQTMRRKTKQPIIPVG